MKTSIPTEPEADTPIYKDIRYIITTALGVAGLIVLIILCQNAGGGGVYPISEKERADRQERRQLSRFKYTMDLK